MAPRKITLIHNHAPGDTVVLTGLVRDIALAKPGQFEIDVKTSAMDIWQNNPYLTPLGGVPGVEQVRIQYGKGIKDQKYETVHFLAYFHRDFEIRCKTRIPLTKPTPDLHLSERERTIPLVDGRYWVVVAGGKSDVTVKVWSATAWQRTVNLLRDQGLRIVQIGSVDSGHYHPTLDGVLRLVGQTNLRDMIRLIHHAEGVLCPITCAMHMSAALEKPCVVLAGGREAPWWEGYYPENIGLGGPAVAKLLRMPHRYLHTIGLLDCCKSYGCWVNKSAPLNGDKSLCKQPVALPGQVIPKCLDMLTPEYVTAAALSYYLDGSIPPPPGTKIAETVQALHGALVPA